MAVIIDCAEKRKNSKGQLVKSVCKNYHSKKHKKQCNKYNQAREKYQNHKNKGRKKMPVIPPQIQAGIQAGRKGITTVLLNGAPPPSNNLDSNVRAPTQGQQRMLNTINRMQKHYSNPTHNIRNVIVFKGK